MLLHNLYDDDNSQLKVKPKQGRQTWLSPFLAVCARGLFTKLREGVLGSPIQIARSRASSRSSRKAYHVMVVFLQPYFRLLKHKTEVSSWKAVFLFQIITGKT